MMRRRRTARTLAYLALIMLAGCLIEAPVSAQTPPPAGTETQPANEDEQQAIALLADLQRFASESPEELRRELSAAGQAVTRGRTEANRVRLAVLLTMPATGASDDARALTLLDGVVKGGGNSPVKQLASVLYIQVSERVRNVAEERRKTAAAQEKLDQLRAVERSLLLERNRNAGGAGGGGGGGTGR
jgi:hypothetical protein